MKQHWLALALQLGQLGFLIALPLVGGLLLGIWADRSLGTVPLFTLLGSLLGIAAGTMAMYRFIVRAIAQAEKLSPPKKRDGAPRGRDISDEGEEK